MAELRRPARVFRSASGEPEPPVATEMPPGPRVRRAPVARLVGFLAVFGALFVLGSTLAGVLLTPRPGPVQLPLPADPTQSYRLFLYANAYHAALVFEQPTGWRLGPPGQEEAPFIEVAWGDRRYFMESDFRPHALFASTFLPTASVGYVRAWRQAPASPPPSGMLLATRVSADTLRALVASIEASFVRSPDGLRAEAFPPVPEYPGRFYPSRLPYFIWSNCNGWVIRRLADAGLARGAWFTLHALQLPGRLRGFRSADDPE